MIYRWTVWLLAALLVVLVVVFVVYMPPSSLETLKPIPAHAHIVYRSETPGGFLSFFSDLSSCSAEAGPLALRLRPADAGRSVDDLPPAALCRTARILKESPLTVATVSLGGRSRRDTWVAVSAIGPYSVFFRWKLTLFRPEHSKSVRSYGAWRVWQYSSSSVPSWANVRFALTEGLLICSISDDSHDIYYLLDTLDGRRPSLADRKDSL